MAMDVFKGVLLLLLLTGREYITVQKNPDLVGGV
jgi:hypothetical protein